MLTHATRGTANIDLAKEFLLVAMAKCRQLMSTVNDAINIDNLALMKGKEPEESEKSYILSMLFGLFIAEILLITFTGTSMMLRTAIVSG
jgi:hypothetical protein